jgi:plasmid stability protein
MLEQLKAKAKRHGRSLQSEFQFIIREVLNERSLSDEETAATIKRSLRGRKFSDSAVLLRRDRQR